MNLQEYVDSKKAELNRRTHFSTDDAIEQTARDLEEMGYEPPVFLPVKGFLRFRVKDIHNELERIAALDPNEVAELKLAQEKSPEEVKKRDIDILTNQFLLLERLRAGEPEAWDEIHELYEDD